MIPKLEKELIERWHDTLIDDEHDTFLDFAEGLHINEFVVENGERVIYFEDGMYYIAHGWKMGEKDGVYEKEIIDALEECGIDFKEK